MSGISAQSRAIELLPDVIGLARRAGAAILEIYRESNHPVVRKPDESPLTLADLASHRILVEGLTALTPQCPVLSEESSEVPYEERRSWGCFWLVDPLDGTKEFLSRSGEFTINIALVAANHPALGVVYAPALGRLYYAAQGAGAWKSDGGEPSRICVAPARGGVLRAVISREHCCGEAELDRLWPGAERCEYSAVGSSLKFCMVAEGAADVYPRLGPTMEWDTAAAHCIVEEAGGAVTDLEGNSLAYNKESLRNPSFLARAQKHINIS